MIGSTNLVLLKLLKWNLNHNLFLHQKGYCWRCFLRKDALLRSYTLEKAIRLSLGWIFWITSNIFKRFEGKVLSQFCVKCYDCYREESQLPGPGAWILPAAEGGAGAGAGAGQQPHLSRLSSETRACDEDRDIVTGECWLVLCSDPSVPQPVVQSRRRPLLGPSPGWKRLLALSHLGHY